MNITGLQIEGFKRIRAVVIKPDGSPVIEIRGKNGAGKSSILDAIWVALAGSSAAPAVPIRHDAEEARICVNLGELIVTRVFKRGKAEVTTSLTVTAADGAKYSKPQSMLDDLVGSLTFDPLHFSRLDKKAQFDQLRKLVPGIDFDAIQRAHDGDMDRRKDINSQARSARAAATLITLPPNLPAEPVDEAALVDQLQKAGETNTGIETRKNNRARAVDSIEAKRNSATGWRVRAEELRAQAQAAEDDARKADAEADELQNRLDAAEPLPEPVDVTAVTAQINAARITNANVAKAKQKAEHVAKAEALEKQADDITAVIEKRQTDKQASIAAAAIPVPGITFGEGEILLNGVPFGQSSSAEQLRASIGIAGAMNPRLRVIMVRDGSLLDEQSLALVAQFAAENDLQVWMEIVDSKGASGIVIEDGAVREVQAEASAA